MIDFFLKLVKSFINIINLYIYSFMEVVLGFLLIHRMVIAKNTIIMNSFVSWFFNAFVDFLTPLYSIDFYITRKVLCDCIFLIGNSESNSNDDKGNFRESNSSKKVKIKKSFIEQIFGYNIDDLLSDMRAFGFNESELLKKKLHKRLEIERVRAFYFSMIACFVYYLIYVYIGFLFSLLWSFFITVWFFSFKK